MTDVSALVCQFIGTVSYQMMQAGTIPHPTLMDALKEAIFVGLTNNSDAAAVTAAVAAKARAGGLLIAPELAKVIQRHADEVLRQHAASAAAAP